MLVKVGPAWTYSDSGKVSALAALFQWSLREICTAKNDSYNFIVELKLWLLMAWHLLSARISRIIETDNCISGLPPGKYWRNPAEFYFYNVFIISHQLIFLSFFFFKQISEYHLSHTTSYPYSLSFCDLSMIARQSLPWCDKMPLWQRRSRHVMWVYVAIITP